MGAGSIVSFAAEDSRQVGEPIAAEPVAEALAAERCVAGGAVAARLATVGIAAGNSVLASNARGRSDSAGRERHHPDHRVSK